jgi:hypothetical protein
MKKSSEHDNPRTYSSAKDRYRNQDKHRWRKVGVWLIPVVLSVLVTLDFFVDGVWFIWSVALTIITFFGYTVLVLEWCVWKVDPARKRLRIAFLIVCALTLLTALGRQSSVPRTTTLVESLRPVPVPVPSIADRSAVENREYLDIKREKLLEFFDKYNEAQSETLVKPYIGKWMEIPGRVRNVSREALPLSMQDGVPYKWGIKVILSTASGDKKKLAHIVTQATFDDQRWMDRAAVLKRNEDIKIRGQIRLVFNSGFALDHCEIVEQ